MLAAERRRSASNADITLDIFALEGLIKVTPSYVASSLSRFSANAKACLFTFTFTLEFSPLWSIPGRPSRIISIFDISILAVYMPSPRISS